MPFDKTKNQRKGFCFITFDSEQVVNELLKTPKQKINDKEVCILVFVIPIAHLFLKFIRNSSNARWSFICFGIK